MKKYQTYFCDIDGTILKYRKFESYKETPAQLTPGTLEKLNEMHEAGHMIVLTTARPKDLRAHTEMELSSLRIPWDHLIMGLERGPRHLINDMDPGKPGKRALAYNVKRDEGLSHIEVKNY